MKKEKKKMNMRVVLAVILSLIVVAGLVAGLVWLCSDRIEAPVQPETPAVTDEPTTPSESIVTSYMETISVELGHGMKLTDIGAYTGVYMEDGTDEIVSGVLMVIVTNTGTDAIEYAKITVPTDEGEAQFSVTTLLPGTSVVLLEQNRRAHTGQEHYEQASANTVAKYRAPLSLCEDKLQIQILDGAINVKNISGQDIPGDILIYYKNAAEDLYYGGITYRVRIEGGLNAEEIRQMMASHFSESGSQIMFVTVAE